MVKTKLTAKLRFAPIAAGQIWRVEGMNLQVSKVGPLMVQYKLAAPDALKASSQIQSKVEVEKYLKKKKAVLLSA